VTDSAPWLDRDEYFQDPQSYFARLRESRSVTAVDLPGSGRAWLITRYEEARAALADPRLAKDPRKMFPDWQMDPRVAMFNLHMLNLDPPDHTRLRRLVQKAFTPGRVAALRPRVEEIAALLLDAMAARATTAPDGVVDLVDQFAFRLPITVVCELLGIPARHQDDFRAWTSIVISSEHDRGQFQEAADAML
jgi:cytochrome P450